MLFIGYLIILITWGFWLFSVVKCKSQSNGFDFFLTISSFLIPFYSISFGLFGVQISIYKLIPIILFITYLNSSNYRLPKAISNLFLYFVFNSLFFYCIALLTGKFDFLIELGRNPKTAYFSPIIQSILFLTSIFQIWFISKKSKINHLKTLSYFVYGMLVLNFIGYVQLFCYKFSIPWFQYWFLGDALGRNTDEMWQLANNYGVFRMSSLGGEPRHLAANMILGIFILIYLRSKNKKINLITGKLGIFSIAILSSGILLTFSASGLLSFITGTFVFLILSRSFKLIFFIIIPMVFIIVFPNEFEFLSSVFWKLKNIDYILYAAPKDTFALKSLLDNFTNFIFGYGISMAELFKPEKWLYYETPFKIVDKLKDNPSPMDSVVHATSPIIQMLVNGGLLGFTLIIISFKNRLKTLNKKTVIFFITILSLMIFSSTLIFTIGMFLISIIFDYESKQKTTNYQPRT